MWCTARNLCFNKSFKSNCTISTRILNLRVWFKKWSNWTSGAKVGQKNPTPTPSVVRNPTPPKNLRLRNPGKRGSGLSRRVWNTTLLCYGFRAHIHSQHTWKANAFSSVKPPSLRSGRVIQALADIVQHNLKAKPRAMRNVTAGRTLDAPGLSVRFTMTSSSTHSLIYCRLARKVARRID